MSTPSNIYTFFQVEAPASVNESLRQIADSLAKLDLAVASGTGGGGTSASVLAEWTFDTSTVAADPGARDLRYNNATPASVTAIYISSTTNNNADFDNILDEIAPGDSIYIQTLADSSEFLLMQVTSTLDNTGWWTINGVIQSSGGLPSNNDRLGVLMFKAAGGGGGGGGGTGNSYFPSGWG